MLHTFCVLLLRKKIHYLILTNKSLRLFLLLKPTIGTSGKTLGCCASGVNNKLIPDKMCFE